MRVLLAEDNPVNQEVAVGLLETLDCAVTVVADGRQAVEAVADGRFDLVLMDCQMPEMDGLDATRKIRASVSVDATLPIVALTANDVETTRAACLEAGMNDFLGKPFRRDDLGRMLQRWCPGQAAVVLGEAAADTDPPSSLDPAPIEALRALDPSGESGIVHRAITKFVDYSDELVARLTEAAGSGDVDHVARIAHSLKSSSANLGASDLARQCADIEGETASGCLPDDIDRRLAVLQDAHRSARRDLLRLDDAG